MRTEQRRREIVRRVRDLGSVSREQLAADLDVTAVTIYRDLRLLEEQGQLRMVRGGAVPVTVEEPYSPTKRRAAHAQKAAIARLAADLLLADGDVVTLESGTTVGELIPDAARAARTILCNGLEVVSAAAAAHPAVEILCSGGLFRARSRTFVGERAAAFFAELASSVAFMSASGYTAERGFTDANTLEIQVKRAMCAGARRTVMLLDSTKFGTVSLAPFAAAAEIDVLVTDAQAPEADVAALRAHGVVVHIASV